MATTLKRITFVVPPEMDESLDLLKKELFYNCSQSYMLRKLLQVGIESLLAAVPEKTGECR